MDYIDNMDDAMDCVPLQRLFIHSPEGVIAEV